MERSSSALRAIISRGTDGTVTGQISTVGSDGVDAANITADYFISDAHATETDVSAVRIPALLLPRKYDEKGGCSVPLEAVIHKTSSIRSFSAASAAQSTVERRLVPLLSNGTADISALHVAVQCNGAGRERVGPERVRRDEVGSDGVGSVGVRWTGGWWAPLCSAGGGGLTFWWSLVDGAALWWGASVR